MDAATQPRRAGLYARISQDRDGTMLGVERQREDCERLIAARGWELAGVYVDNDASAYSGRPRPEYQRLMRDLEAGAIDAVVAWHPDRLHRSPRELEDFVSLVEARGAAVETATAGIVDLATPTGRMVARIVGATARFESEHKAERIRRKVLEQAARGEHNRGGSRPYGLTADWSAEVPEEAAVVREAARRVLAGESVRSIIRDLEARGIRSVSGGPWSAVSMRRVLTGWRTCGYREHEGERVARGSWPAILDLETVEALRAIMLDPSRRFAATNVRSAMLVGILECPCGRRLVSRPTVRAGVGRVNRYGCMPRPLGCGGTVILAEQADLEVQEQVLARLESPAVAEALARRSGADVAEVAARVRAAEASLEQLARDHYADRIIGRAEYLAARDALEKRLDADRATLSAAAGAPAAGLTGRARERWPELTLDQRRALIGTVASRIVVLPGRRGYNRFDPDRLAVTWRA